MFPCSHGWTSLLASGLAGWEILGLVGRMQLLHEGDYSISDVYPGEHRCSLPTTIELIRSLKSLPHTPPHSFATTRQTFSHGFESGVLLQDRTIGLAATSCLAAIFTSTCGRSPEPDQATSTN